MICFKNRNITHCQTAKISLRLRYRFCAFLPNSRSRSKIFHQTIRLRVKYFLFGDRQIRELMLPRHSLTVVVMHGAAVHSMYCLIIAFIPAVNTTKILGPCRCYNVGAGSVQITISFNVKFRSLGFIQSRMARWLLVLL